MSELLAIGIVASLRQEAVESMRLLLLEDDLHLGKGLTKALAQEGFSPQWLRRAQDARALLEQEGVAIALVDIGLPDGSGLDLLRWIRERGDPYPPPPTIWRNRSAGSRSSRRSRIEGLRRSCSSSSVCFA